MILNHLSEAERGGARLDRACAVLGLSHRTVQRWRLLGGGDDRRAGPRISPPNKLSPSECQDLLSLVDLPEFCDLSPHQIVPRLADRGIYVASESTIYRLLRQAKKLSHRQRSRPPVKRQPQERLALGPNEVWSWDITYLPSPVRGQFFYLYLILDVWSRKIVGARVYDREAMELGAELFEQTCLRLNLDPQGLVLHADNGGPMRGSTMLATLARLGVEASFSRPRVSDDNPYSEALFRTLKYRPEYPPDCFASIEEAQAWLEWFVRWYNTEHLHSALRFVTPQDRHEGRDKQILTRRKNVYEKARQRKPLRWSGSVRNCQPIGPVRLNGTPRTSKGSTTRLEGGRQHCPIHSFPLNGMRGGRALEHPDSTVA